MTMKEWMISKLPRSVCTALTCTTIFCSCSKEDPRIKIPVVEGFEAPADDPDLLPVYDRGYYQRMLPDDGRCRVRYTADYDYDVYAGNRAISDRTSPTYLYAAQLAAQYESQGLCRREPESCEIVPLRQGYAVTISGDRFNPYAERDWNELARHINALSRYGVCTGM